MIYVLSGGTGKLFAVIAVTYPAGSICTCGGKKAQDTSGYALFNVKAGTYTVECHTSDNSKSTNKSVTVAESDKGKSKSVTLAYELVLYDAGDACTDVTGGWSNGGDGGLLSLGSTSMQIESSEYQKTTNACTVNKIDLTNVATLYFRLTCSTTYPTGYPRIAVDADRATSPNDGNFTASKTLSKATSFITVALDVSSITGSQYVLAATRRGDAGGATIEINRIWGDYK